MKGVQQLKTFPCDKTVSWEQSLNLRLNINLNLCLGKRIWSSNLYLVLYLITFFFYFCNHKNVSWQYLLNYLVDMQTSTFECCLPYQATITLQALLINCRVNIMCDIPVFNSSNVSKFLSLLMLPGSLSLLLRPLATGLLIKSQTLN